jgi:predicted nucleic acid-binding protein
VGPVRTLARLVTGYLVDTDVLVDHLRGARTFSLAEQSDAAYSVITRAELYAGRRATEQPIETLLGSMLEVGISGEVATRAGELRRVQGMALADALIAATALVEGRVVLTRNTKDFAGIPDVQVEQPA